VTRDRREPGQSTSTSRSRVRRLPNRGRYDRATIDAILDEGLVCHLGLVKDGSPYVYPTLYTRLDDTVIIHGSVASRSLGSMSRGADVCLSVTLVDGLVLARSAFHHSINYRSVVLFGRATAILDPDRKLDALRSITEHVVPGRWGEVRPPNDQELKATLVLEMPIAEGSAKVRAGGPIDDEEDYASPIWAGVLPLRQVLGVPLADPRLADDVPVPGSVDRLIRDRSTER
jgi:nitroimidazol reductase NimA-like FMN-containing flavoprotein (pyridoxamine 5'-phosphate oxidase superfamily)